MAFSGKILAQGQLSNSKTTLYTVPGGTKAYIRFFRCSNVGVNVETILVFYKKSTSRRIGRAVLAVDEAVDFTEQDVLVLDAGDLLEGQTTTAASVDYVISGAEES
jgi:hypothetical protein